nr:hypothetical protein [Micromonospora sp. DSM 115978]
GRCRSGSFGVTGGRSVSTRRSRPRCGVRRERRAEFGRYDHRLRWRRWRRLDDRPAGSTCPTRPGWRYRLGRDHGVVEQRRRTATGLLVAGHVGTGWLGTSWLEGGRLDAGRRFGCVGDRRDGCWTWGC